jgi:hypothetical protein
MLNLRPLLLPEAATCGCLMLDYADPAARPIGRSCYVRYTHAAQQVSRYWPLLLPLLLLLLPASRV